MISPVIAIIITCCGMCPLLAEMLPSLRGDVVTLPLSVKKAF